MGIQSFLDSCEKTAHCYFWTSYGNASSRRSAENRLSDSLNLTVELKRIVKKVERVYFFNITAELRISMSCKNVYRHVNTYINGISTNIMSLRSILAIQAGEKPLTAAFVKKFNAQEKLNENLVATDGENKKLYSIGDSNIVY